MEQKKVWFITGSSSGIGYELAKEALTQGYCVVATARKTETIHHLMEQYPDTAISCPLDVTQPQQAHDAIATAIAKFGRIDIVVNNAAYGLVGAVEEASNEEIRRQFDTNLFGVINVTRAALPTLREQKSGHILNISSFVGLAALPSFGYTCATKFALEGLSESLAQEVAGLGIKVTLIEPGLFRTKFGNTQSLVIAQNRIADYQSTDQTVGFMKGMDGKQPNDPTKAAQAMIRIV